MLETYFRVRKKMCAPIGVIITSSGLLLVISGIIEGETEGFGMKEKLTIGFVFVISGLVCAAIGFKSSNDSKLNRFAELR